MTRSRARANRHRSSNRIRARIGDPRPFRVIRPRDRSVNSFARPQQPGLAHHPRLVCRLRSDIGRLLGRNACRGGSRFGLWCCRLHGRRGFGRMAREGRAEAAIESCAAILRGRVRGGCGASAERPADVVQAVSAEPSVGNTAMDRPAVRAQFTGTDAMMSTFVRVDEHLHDTGLPPDQNGIDEQEALRGNGNAQIGQIAIHSRADILAFHAAAGDLERAVCAHARRLCPGLRSRHRDHTRRSDHHTDASIPPQGNLPPKTPLASPKQLVRNVGIGAVIHTPCAAYLPSRARQC